MSNTVKNKGHCLCGAVHFTAAYASKSVGACHCSMCRKWGGGPLMVSDCGVDVEFAGEENVIEFNSSDWAVRGFCQQCGTHLFYKLKGSQQYMIPVGLFESDDGFVFDHQVFVEERPSYYCFSNQTSEMTGAELFAKYTPTS